MACLPLPSTPGVAGSPSAYRNRHAVPDIIPESAAVPGGIERLNVARLVRRPTHELVLSRLGVPRETPATPRVLARRRIKRRLLPRAVHAHLDHGNRHSSARPGAPVQLDRPALDEPSPRVPVRNAGRHHQGFHAHMRDRNAFVARVLTVDIRPDLLEAIEWPV